MDKKFFIVIYSYSCNCCCCCWNINATIRDSLYKLSWVKRSRLVQLEGFEFRLGFLYGIRKRNRFGSFEKLVIVFLFLDFLNLYSSKRENGELPSILRRYEWKRHRMQLVVTWRHCPPGGAPAHTLLHIQ